MHKRQTLSYKNAKCIVPILRLRQSLDFRPSGRVWGNVARSRAGLCCTSDADARLACRSDDAFAGIDQTFDGIELAVDAVEVAMLNDHAEHHSKGWNTRDEKKLDGGHLPFPPFPRGLLGDSPSQSTPAGRRSSGLQTCTFSCIARAFSPDWVSIVR